MLDSFVSTLASAASASARLTRLAKKPDSAKELLESPLLAFCHTHQRVGGGRRVSTGLGRLHSRGLSASSRGIHNGKEHEDNPPIHCRSLPPRSHSCGFGPSNCRHK